MTRARNSANLASQGNLFVDISNDRTGIGSVVPAQNLHVAGTAGFHGDTTFVGDLYNTTWDRSENSLVFNDNAKVAFGNGSKATIRHSGSQLFVNNNNGNLYLRVGDENGVLIVPNADVRLFYNGTQTFATADYGVNVTGTTDTDGLVVSGVATVTTMNVTGVLTYDDVTSVDSVGIVTARDHINIVTDNKKLQLGAGQDLELFHSGSHSFILNNTGNLVISNMDPDEDNEIHLRARQNEQSIVCKNDGAVELYHNNSKKIETTNTGIDVTGTAIADALNVTGTSVVATLKSTNNNYVMQLQGNNATDKVYLGTTSGNDFILANTSSVTERLRIDSSGNVLVGTTDATIYDNGDSASEGIVLRAGEVIDIARKGDLQLTLNRQTNDGPHIAFYRSGSVKSFISTRSNAFCIDTGGTNERLRITSAGAVGINTTVDAATKLQVQSDGTSTTAAGNIVARFQSNGSGRDATIQLSDNVANSATISMLSSSFVFKQAGTETLRITSQGRIGLNGVVPTSSHANVTSSIHLADSNTILSRTGNQYFALFQNLKYTSADQVRYLVNGYASAYAQNAGSHRFYTVGNGTANTAATVTERLRITSAGDFGTNGVTPTTQAGRVFHLHAGSAQQRFHMTNNTTGTSATDGFEILIDTESNANCRIRNFEAGYMAFDTGGTERVRIDSSGRLLIGTTTEGETTADDLTIATSGNTGMTIRSGTSSEGNIFFSDGTSGDAEYRGIVRYEHNNDAFVIKTTGSERVRILSDGKFGIGDFTSGTAVSQALHVKGSQPEIFLEHTGGQDMTLTTNDGMGQNGITVNGGFLSLAYNNKNIVMCRTGGNVGINQTSPQRYLHITGNDGATGATLGNSDTLLVLDNLGVNGPIIEFASATNGAGRIQFTDTDAANRGRIEYTHSDDAMRIRTAGTERWVITQHGSIANYTSASHDQGAGTFNIRGTINQYSQGSGSGLIFDCDFGRLTGYGDDTNVTNGTNLSGVLAHSTTDWTSSSSNTPISVNGGTFQYRVGFGGYFDCISNGGRVSIGAGSGVPAMGDKLNTASMTIETWVWYDGDGREVIVSRFGSGFPNQFNMLADPNGQFHYNNSGVGAGSGNISGEHFPDKTWHHHVWQYDSGAGGVNRWYINGAFANSRNVGSSLAVSSGTGFAIASRADQMENWRGKIAVVRIYNRALSSYEIKNHFELDRGRFGI